MSVPMTGGGGGGIVIGPGGGGGVGPVAGPTPTFYSLRSPTGEYLGYEQCSNTFIVNGPQTLWLSDWNGTMGTFLTTAMHTPPLNLSLTSPTLVAGATVDMTVDPLTGGVVLSSAGTAYALTGGVFQAGVPMVFTIETFASGTLGQSFCLSGTTWNGTGCFAPPTYPLVCQPGTVVDPNNANTCKLNVACVNTSTLYQELAAMLGLNPATDDTYQADPAVFQSFATNLLAACGCSPAPEQVLQQVLDQYIAFQSTLNNPAVVAIINGINVGLNILQTGQPQLGC